jgi:hypothetical protein
VGNLSWLEEVAVIAFAALLFSDFDFDDLARVVRGVRDSFRR